MKKWNTAFFIILTAVISCAPAGKDVLIKQPAAPAKQDSASWKIAYNVSGGFAGIQQKMKLSSDGKLTVIDQRQEKKVEIQASAEQLAAITEALAKIDFSQMQQTASALSDKCRDCFEYRIMVFMNGKQYQLRFDDLTLNNSDCAPLADILSAMLNQARMKLKL